MKGLVFTELLEMVENTYGDEVLDQVIEKSHLPNKGSYTAVGTYEYTELVRILVALSNEVNVEIPTLLKVYGHHIFKVFASHYPQFFEGVEDAFTFLQSIEKHIHVEVRKLYPDAELPTFESKRISDNELHMTYLSSRKMGDFAHGLIEECMLYFEEQSEVKKLGEEDGGAKVKFVITR